MGMISTEHHLDGTSTLSYKKFNSLFRQMIGASRLPRKVPSVSDPAAYLGFDDCSFFIMSESMTCYAIAYIREIDIPLYTKLEEKFFSNRSPLFASRTRKTRGCVFFGNRH